MNLIKYEKVAIAHKMLETALSLFFERKDYFSVLQIAGACDEIFGKCLKLKGVAPSLEVDVAAINSIKKSLSGFENTHKDTRDLLNKAKNSIKHMNDNVDTTVEMDPEYESEEMLERAIRNCLMLKEKSTPLMEKFWDFTESKYVSKAGDGHRNL